MLMTDATGVNTPRAVMLSIGAIAERDGVSSAAVSRKVKELVANHGLAVERDARGRVSAVNAAEYDHLRGRFGDPSKAQGNRPAAPKLDLPQGEESYDEALRQKTWHEAEKRRLELEELRGDLVRASKVGSAAARCAEQIVRVINRLNAQIEPMAAAVGKDGPHGLRVLVKKLINEQREEIANALQGLADAAPMNEGDVEDEAPAPEQSEAEPVVS